MDPPDLREGRRGRGFLARYLASKAGAGYLVQIKAAKSWGFMPTAMILGDPKRSRPGKWDLLLAEAEQILELERCPQCGNPRYICQNEDPDVDFRVYDEVCHAMRKKAKYEESKKDKKGREGAIVGIEAYTHSDTPFDEFRGPFYRQKSEEREQIEESRVIRPREHPPGWTPEEEA